MSDGIDARSYGSGGDLDRVNFRLPRAQNNELERLVAAGQYPTKSEAIREAIRLLLAAHADGESYLEVALDA